MERPVAHEVPDKFRKVARHDSGRVVVGIGRPVRVRQRRQLYGFRLADEPTEHQGHAIAGSDIGKPPPLPETVLVNDLDPVGGCSLDLIAAASSNGYNRLGAVDIELSRLFWTLVRRDPHIEVLPLIAVSSTELSETDEAAIGQDETVTDKAAGRGQDRRLGVAVSVTLAQSHCLIPDLARRANDGIVDAPRL